MEERQDRLLAGIEEAAKKLAECSEGTDVIRNLSNSFRRIGIIGGRTQGKTFALLKYLHSQVYTPKRKMPRKQKKAFIKKHGRAAYHRWQRTTPLLQLTPWRAKIPDFNIELIPPKFLEPMVPDRNLLFVSDYWNKNLFWEKYYMKPSIIWVNDISI